MKYSITAGQQVIELMHTGLTMLEIAATIGCTAFELRGWGRQYPEFAAAVQGATTAQAAAMVDRGIAAIASAAGDVQASKAAAELARSLQWAASRLDRAAWGDRQGIEVNVLHTMDEAQLQARLADLLRDDEGTMRRVIEARPDLVPDRPL